MVAERTLSPRVTHQNSLEAALPPLAQGDRLSRAEFERRYHAMPHVKRAELIEGVVYMPSPVKHKQHGNPHAYLNTWVGVYVASTPGTDLSDNATVRLDNQNEPQPDILLRIERVHGGRSFISADDYIEGAPEFVVEVAGCSASYDMHDKKLVYARNGVREYLVVLTFDRTVHWFVLRDGEYEELAPADDGILRSEFFAGLWLKPDALWANKLAEMLAVLQQGLATPEHATFVERLTDTSA
jgi:Uma2 family endonuclease